MSYARMLSNDAVWAGGYTDLLYDFGRDQTRFTVGPEFGWTVFGMDGGYLLGHDRERTRHGFVVRPLVTYLFVAAYYRLGVFMDEREAFHEFGLLFKIPIIGHQ